MERMVIFSFPASPELNFSIPMATGKKMSRSDWATLLGKLRNEHSEYYMGFAVDAPTTTGADPHQ
jgi:hypothetical protein